MTSYREFYRDRAVLITGGLGFIGSSLAHQLVTLGARVLIVDSLIPAYGGNLFNINGIEQRVRVNIADLGRSSITMTYEIVNAKTEQTLVRAKAVIVTFDYTANKATPIPAEARDVLAKLRQ